MNVSWKTNWNEFTEMIESRSRAGDSSEEISAGLSGVEISWTGVLDRKDVSELAPSVGIALPQKELVLGDGRTATISGVGLSVADTAVSDWNRIEIGTPVTFTARIGIAGTPFLPVQVKTLRSGRTIVMISLSEGVPVTTS